MKGQNALRLRQRRTLLWTLGLVTAGLLYGILLGNHGLHRYLELRSTESRRSGEAYIRVARNRALRERIEGLRTDPRALESEARAKLGVAGKNEIVYVFRTQPSSPH